VVKEGAVENFFYHLDASDVSVNTVLEKVTYDPSSNLSRYEVFTKPTGDLNVSADASMLDVSTTKTSVRSVLFEALNTSVEELSASGNAAITGTLDVTGNTSLTNFAASGTGEVAGQLDVVGATSLSTVTTSGLATMDSASVTGALDVTGNTALTNLAVSGEGSVLGPLSVTGDTSLGNTTIQLGTGGALTVGGNGNVAFGSNDVSCTANVTFTGRTSISNLTLTGNNSLTGNLDMCENQLCNTSAVEATNVRLLLDTAAGAILSQTLDGNTWSSTTAASSNAFVIFKDTTIGANVLMQGLDVSVGDVGTATPLTVFGPTDLRSSVLVGGSLAVTGSTTLGDTLSVGGSLDMNGFAMTNVSNVHIGNIRTTLSTTETGGAWSVSTYNGSAWSPTLSATEGQVQVESPLVAKSWSSVAGNLMVGGNISVGGSTVFGSEVSPTTITLFGDLDIKGITTNTRIESNIVQVGDKNIELGFLEIDNLANLNGAGITIGGGGGIIATRPELVYNAIFEAWQPNIDILTMGPLATDSARMVTDGHFISSSVADANVFTKMDSTSINFGNKWRLQLNSVDDTMELQHFESSTWVPKFTYSA